MSATVKASDVTVLVDQQVLQRVSKPGTTVGRVQVTKCLGRYFEILFWYTEAGRLERLTSREMTAATVQQTYGCA